MNMKMEGTGRVTETSLLWCFFMIFMRICVQEDMEVQV